MGMVVDSFPLKRSVMVEFPTGVQQEFELEQIQPLDELEALKKKAQEPCSKHEGGECDCNKDKSQVQPEPAASRKKKRK